MACVNQGMGHELIELLPHDFGVSGTEAEGGLVTRGSKGVNLKWGGVCGGS